MTALTETRLSAGARLEAAGARLLAAAGAAAVLGAVRIHRPGALSTVCLLRATTGVPCPLCGGTTAFARLGQRRWAAAFAANPFVLLLAVALVLAPTGAFRPLARLGGRSRWLLTGGLVAASWGWQLHRFAFL